MSNESLEREINELKAQLEALQAKLAQTVKSEPVKEEVTPEVLAMIAAAVSTFLGKKIRIRSAKALQSPYEVVNPWSQQGRLFVQASHNLR